jgi:hypothetical protein
VAEREPYVDDFRVSAPGDRVRWIHLAPRIPPSDVTPEFLQGIAVDVTDFPPGAAALGPGR